MTRALIYISMGNSVQNVNDKSAHRHFDGELRPKCQRQEHSYTFRGKTSTKMSMTRMLIGISTGKCIQNVNDKRFSHQK